MGPAIAAETEPVSEREGVVTVSCASSLWAQELELMSADLSARLDAEIGAAKTVRKLRFTVSPR